MMPQESKPIVLIRELCRDQQESVKKYCNFMKLYIPNVINAKEHIIINDLTNTDTIKNREKKCYFIFKNNNFTKRRKKKMKALNVKPEINVSKTRLNIKHRSMPKLISSVHAPWKINLTDKKSDGMLKKHKKYFDTTFVVNTLTTDGLNPYLSPFLNKFNFSGNTQVYRCQMTGKDDCCCCCNSDLMFEVMKGLYDCYKKKNCDNCTCLLCSRLHKPELIKKTVETGTGSGVVSLTEVKKQKTTVGSLPEGQTPSALLAKVKTSKPSVKATQSEKLKKAKKEVSLTGLEGKSPEMKEKLLEGLAMHGTQLPEGKTMSEKSLIMRVKKNLGLPPRPKTPSQKEKYDKALVAGLITPLKGKSKSKIEKILKGQANFGIVLPDGRTPSEKELIKQINKKTSVSPKLSLTGVPSEKIKKAKEAGLLTPLHGKTAQEKEQIIKGLAKHGIPLPAASSVSTEKVIDKVRKEVGLPPGPKTQVEKEKYRKALAAGLLTQLEGKSPGQKEKILKAQADLGIPLPKGRTPEEKAQIASIKAASAPVPLVPGAPMKKGKTEKEAGLITPLRGKTPEQKEKILKGLILNGIPLPDGKSSSDKMVLKKVREDIGLPPEPLSPAGKERYNKALALGLVTPLSGKSLAQKEKILQNIANVGLPLPNGNTPSEKQLIKKTRAKLGLPPEPKTESQRKRQAKAYDDGIIIPLKGKSRAQKEKILTNMLKAGLKLPVGTTTSEMDLIHSVKTSIGLRSTTPSEKLIKAQKAGLITPLTGKTKAEKNKILEGRIKLGLTLPEGKTTSEKDLIKKFKKTPGYTSPGKVVSTATDSNISPETSKEAKAAGLITPLKGKTKPQREKILKGLLERGIPLPEGETPSEKNLINKILKENKKPAGKPSSDELAKKLIGRYSLSKEEAQNFSKKIEQAKAEGFLNPFEGKNQKEKEKKLKGLAKIGIPLPEGKTVSEKQLVNKVIEELGLPPHPKTSSDKKRYQKAYASGVITPLHGKSLPKVEIILTELAKAGVPLPKGRTNSEKALVAKINALNLSQPSPKESSVSQTEIIGGPQHQGKMKTKKPESSGIQEIPVYAPPEKILKARAAGLLNPLEGKDLTEKERKLRELVKLGMPLPEGRTKSEKKLVKKIIIDLGLPPLPKTPSDTKRYQKAYAQGIITPLQGKSLPDIEKNLTKLAKAGVPLPQGRTKSEKALVSKINALNLSASTPEELSVSQTKMREVPQYQGKKKPKKPETVGSQEIPIYAPPEKILQAKAAGLLNPLDGKNPKEKERKLRELVKIGMPLPGGRTKSEKKIVKKIINEFGLPPLPKTPSDTKRYQKAYAQGLITPLQGKSLLSVEKNLTKLAKAGVPLPQGRTKSEKALVAKINALNLSPSTSKVSSVSRTEIEIKRVPQYKGKRKLKKLEPSRIHETPIYISPEKILKAKAAGLLNPLEGKDPKEKERKLRELVKIGVPLPEGKTDSEKNLVKKVIIDVGLPPHPKTPSEKKRYKKAYEDGLVIPLHEKTTLQKEKILTDLSKAGLPLPKGRTKSEKELITRIKDLKLSTALSKESVEIPPEIIVVGGPRDRGEIKRRKEITETWIPEDKLKKAEAAGFLNPLEGHSSEEKEKKLKGLVNIGIPLPEGQTSSEIQLVKKIIFELGLPPTPKSSLEKRNYQLAYESGFITPLQGKTHTQKEKILMNLFQAGVPLPQGRTNSEKALIAKINASFDNIKLKKRRVASKEEVFAVDKIKPGVCDKACGCATKKIRFKHSYVKIKVSSPDLSSFCPCPEGCFPTVKSEVVTDEEGIKVIIARSMGVPTFRTDRRLHLNPSQISLNKAMQKLRKRNKIIEKKIRRGTHQTNNIKCVHHYQSYSDTNVTSAKSLINLSETFSSKLYITQNVTQSDTNFSSNKSSSSTQSLARQESWEIFNTDSSLCLSSNCEQNSIQSINKNSLVGIDFSNEYDNFAGFYLQGCPHSVDEDCLQAYVSNNASETLSPSDSYNYSLSCMYECSNFRGRKADGFVKDPSFINTTKIDDNEGIANIIDDLILENTKSNESSVFILVSTSENTSRSSLSSGSSIHSIEISKRFNDPALKSNKHKCIKISEKYLLNYLKTFLHRSEVREI